MAVVVNGHWNADLTGGNHIDRCLIALEYLEDFAEEAAGPKHTARLNLYCRDVVLGCNCLNLSTNENIIDDCSLSLRVHGVLQADRNPGIFGRLNACRMKYLSAKVSKFWSLLEVQLAHCLGLVDDTWVVVVHSVNVGPYLNLVCVDSCSDKRCCVVRPTTLKVVYLTVSVSADKALGNVYLIAFVII